MDLIIYKFGGSYLNDLKNWNKIFRFINRKIKKYKFVIVVSALGRKNDPYSTDTFLKSTDFLSSFEKDALVAIGESISSLRFTNFLRSKKINARCILDNELDINYEDYSFTSDKFKQLLIEFDVLIVPGFKAKDKDNYIRTLGRGGSDLSALIIANSLGLKRVYLHKDTIGVYSTNNDEIYNKVTIDKLSYDQAYRFFSYSGEVVQLKALEYAKENKIDLHVVNLESKKETIISEEENSWCIYGLMNINDKVYLFGNTDDYTLAIIKEFLKEFKSIKYRVRVGILELTINDDLVQNIFYELHKKFLEG